MTIVTVDVRLPMDHASVWEAARQFGAAGFTARQLWECTSGLSRIGIERWIEAMIARDAIKVAPGPQKSVAYLVIAEDAPAGPESSDELARRHMWTAIRVLPQFGAAELGAAASTDAVTISFRVAHAYIRLLAASGVLTVVKPPNSGRPDTGIWRLRPARNTGPLPPRLIQAAFVVDPNLGAPLGEAEGRS